MPMHLSMKLKQEFQQRNQSMCRLCTTLMDDDVNNNLQVLLRAMVTRIIH